MIALQHYPDNLLALPEMQETWDEAGHMLQRGMKPKVAVLTLDRCLKSVVRVLMVNLHNA